MQTLCSTYYAFVDSQTKIIDCYQDPIMPRMIHVEDVNVQFQAKHLLATQFTHKSVKSSRYRYYYLGNNVNA